jgi:hypothetical protein
VTYQNDYNHELGINYTKALAVFTNFTRKILVLIPSLRIQSRYLLNVNKKGWDIPKTAVSVFRN